MKNIRIHIPPYTYYIGGDFLKKIAYLLMALIIINCFILIPKCAGHLISKDMVNNYLKSTESAEEKEKTKKEIIKNILSATGYDKWLEYIDYIELKIYKGDILPNKKDDIIFVLNLSKDTALIAIYEDANPQYYSYQTKITNLVPVKEIFFFKNFLVVEQLLDERLGAFFIDNFIEIFYYDKNAFKSALKKSIYYDEIYKDIWINKEAPDNAWTKKVEKSSIDYLEEDIPKLLSITTNITYKAKSSETPKEEDFKEISKTVNKELYVWNDKDKKFKLEEKIPINE